MVDEGRRRPSRARGPSVADGVCWISSSPIMLALKPQGKNCGLHGGGTG